MFWTTNKMNQVIKECQRTGKPSCFTQRNQQGSVTHHFEANWVQQGCSRVVMLSIALPTGSCSMVIEETRILE